MNRKDRRALKKQGKPIEKEPVYTMKSSDIVKAAIKGPGEAVIRREINKRLLEQDKQFTLDMDTMVLWTLHMDYGFGPKRLKEFYFKMFKRHLEMRKYYEMDDTYPERLKLKEKGADVEEWFNSLFDENGNFKSSEEVSI